MIVFLCMVVVALVSWYFWAGRIDQPPLPKLERGKVLVLYGPESVNKTRIANRYGDTVTVTHEDFVSFYGLAKLFESQPVSVMIIEEVYNWTPQMLGRLRMFCNDQIVLQQRGKSPRIVDAPYVIACSSVLPPDNARCLTIHNVVPVDRHSADHSCWLLAILAFVVLLTQTACTSLSTEIEHVSHPFAGPPFGPQNEEDALTQANFCARREAGSKGQWYIENCLGYSLDDSGFYGPHLTYTGRFGHKFDMVRR